jgi:hypothetical protein
LFQLLDRRIGFHEWLRRRRSGGRPARVVGGPRCRSIPGLPMGCEAAGLRRSWRLAVGILPIWAACVSAIRQSFHATQRPAAAVPARHDCGPEAGRE